jgi:hypothetical protein
LFALVFAAVRYVEWSSAVNLAEFMSATKPSSATNHSGGSAARSIPPEIIFGCPHVRGHHFPSVPRLDQRVFRNPRLQASEIFLTTWELPNQLAGSGRRARIPMGVKV